MVIRAPGAAPIAFFGDPGDAAVGREPRWVTSFDDFPLTSVAVKPTLFAQAADEGWTIVLSHESRQPSAALSATVTASATRRSDLT